jgi:phage baseplate assembly protein W
MSTGIDRFTGRPLSDWPHVVQSILVILTTRIGDRVMRRSFGSAIPGLLGRNLVPATLLRLYTSIAIAIELWEPRFRVRRFEYPGAENSANDLRQGRLGIRMIGDYRPRALSGDMTVETVKTVTL